jgi:transposase
VSLEEQLAAVQAELRARDATIAEQATTIAGLEEKLHKLVEALGQNSRNSHKPPSTDPPGSRPKTPPSGGRRGAKKGHRGVCRQLHPVSEIDAIVDVYPESCGQCGAMLGRVEDTRPRRYQFVDLTPGRHVTEFRRHAVECRCGHRTRAPYDAQLIPASPFGPRLAAVVVLLTGVYHLSREKAKNLLWELFRVTLSVGTISALEVRMSEALIPAVEEAQRVVEQAAVKYTDGTTWLRAGVTRSLWVLASAMATVYRIFEDGKTATIRALFGESLTGFLVSDRATVFGFWAMARRQICWAHLLRKFIAFSERAGPEGAIGRELVECTHLVFAYWHGFKKGILTRYELQNWMRPLRLHIEELLERTVAKRIPELSGSCADVLEHREALWSFVMHEGIEPTNNHAEREIRPLVLWRKRSFGCQGERGERFVERIMTTVATARKQGHDILNFLVQSWRAHQSSTTPPQLIAAT